MIAPLEARPLFFPSINDTKDFFFHPTKVLGEKIWLDGSKKKSFMRFASCLCSSRRVQTKKITFLSHFADLLILLH